MRRIPWNRAAALLGILAAAAGAGPDEAGLRAEVGAHASAGRWEEAQGLAKKLPPPTDDLVSALLTLPGETAAKTLAAVADSGKKGSPAQRAEAWFRLGHYQYARGAYHLAIPAFRIYLARESDGPYASAARYAMGMACLLFHRSRPGKEAYLDTALSYLEPLLEQPQGAYAALGAEASARVDLERGRKDRAFLTVSKALQLAPRDEEAALLLLGIEAAEKDRLRDFREWVRRLAALPLSPEWGWLSQNRPAWAAHSESESKPARSSVRYGLQFGAFEDEANALELKKKLEQSKIPVQLMQEDGWHKVRAGPYPDAEAARKQAARWKADGGWSSFVMPW